MPKPATLITIPPSTGVELTRWALDHYGVRFKEDRHAPLFHVIVQKWHHAPDLPIFLSGQFTLAITRAIIDFFETRAPLDRKLYPQDPRGRTRLERDWSQFHDHMGYATRTWAYYHLLQNKKLLFKPLTEGTPFVERALIWLLYPLYWRLMWKGLKLSLAAVEDGLTLTDKMFDEVGKLLQDGRPYLLGDQFTLADITFCTMASPVIFPPNFGGPLPRLEALDPTLRKTIADYRNTRAGTYVLRTYQDHRVYHRTNEPQ